MLNNHKMNYIRIELKVSEFVTDVNRFRWNNYQKGQDVSSEKDLDPNHIESIFNKYLDMKISIKLYNDHFSSQAMTKLRYYNQLGQKNCKNIIDAAQGEVKLIQNIRQED